MAKEKKQVKKKPAPPKKNIPKGVKPMPFIFAFVIAVITYISFLPSLKNDFTNWDDPTYVTENPLVQSDKTKLNEIFTQPISLNYHPLTILTLAWNYQSAKKTDGKIDAEVFHAWNVWLHVLNTLLVFYFIWLLSGGQLLTAAFTAAVFGVHPMHVESVSWVSERKDVLYTFFFLLSCISYLYYLDKKNILYLILSFILFGLSCLSKAMAVVLPVVLILIDYFKMKEWNWKSLVNKIPFLILSIIIGVKAFQIQSHGAIADVKTFTLFQRLMFGSYGALMYLVKFIYPSGISAFYPYPTYDKHGVIPFFFYLTPLIWVLLIGLIIYGFRRMRALSFSIAFYIITVALVLQFISVGTAIMADRYAYIPYIGIAFIIGWLLTQLAKKYSAAGILIYGACTAFIILLSIQTYSRTQVWKNSAVLWTDVIEKHPDVEVAYKNRGNYYGKELGDKERSYRDYMMLKKMNSKDTKVYSNMGNVYAMRKQPDSALWAYNKALKIDPSNEEAYVNRGNIYGTMNEYDKAISDYNKAEQLGGISENLLHNRGYTYLATGKFREALNDYNRAIQLSPRDGSLYCYRAISNEGLNNITQALADLQTAASLGYAPDPAIVQRIKSKAGK